MVKYPQRQDSASVIRRPPRVSRAPSDACQPRRKTAANNSTIPGTCPVPRGETRSATKTVWAQPRSSPAGAPIPLPRRRKNDQPPLNVWLDGVYVVGPPGKVPRTAPDPGEKNRYRAKKGRLASVKNVMISLQLAIKRRPSGPYVRWCDKERGGNHTHDPNAAMPAQNIA